MNIKTSNCPRGRQYYMGQYILTHGSLKHNFVDVTLKQNHYLRLKSKVPINAIALDLHLYYFLLIQ